MQINLKQLKDELDTASNPIFLFDDDCDGLCSFLLFWRYLREGKGFVVKGRPLVDLKYARKVEENLPDKVFILDIAQVEQAKILADNADVFLKEGGWVLLAVKAQSIDVTRPPSEIYKQEATILRNRGFRVEQVVDLEPYDKAHAMILAQR